MENIEIVFEDADILAVNKPAGLVVNRAQTVAHKTLQDWLEDQVPEIGAGIRENTFVDGWKKMVPEDFDYSYGNPEEIFLRRSGIAHRLDKDTSGVLLVAKHPGSLVTLLKQFKQRTVSKKYQCLAHGTFALPNGTISVPLGRRSGNRKLFGAVSDGRPAHTEYRTLETYANLDVQRILEETGEKRKRFSLYDVGFSLMECFPKTGRTHQIRVHMAHASHPIVGDSSYAGKKRSKLDALWCKRQFLHAAEISFEHPSSGSMITIQAPLAEDLQQVLKYLHN